MGSVGENQRDFYVEALVVGGGFGGVYALHQLRAAGVQVKLVEAGSYFGGTWHWNRYPGARVDSEFPLYQLSIPEVYKTFTWEERFPGGEEIRRYFKHADKILDLSKDAIFNTIIKGVTWDQVWTCNTTAGTKISCRYLVLCTGSSYKKHYPDFKGLEKFSGKLIHSADMMGHNLDQGGKRVGIIGSGATGVQIVQELAKTDCHLTAFIRTPNIAMPMMQRNLTIREQEGSKSFFHVLFDASRHCRGFPYAPAPCSFKDMTPEQREKYYDEIWIRGGFAFIASNFAEFAADKEVNASIYNFWARKVRARIQDPHKRDVVAPLVQEHYFGVKRPSLEQDYYECLDRPNVEVVNLKKTPISEIFEKGVKTSEGLIELDILILATGFDSVTGSLMDLEIHDADGQLLQTKWKPGVQTYLGLMIEKMPNLFMVYSPQAPTALANGPPVIEIQVEWIRDAIKKMKKEGIDRIEPQKEYAVNWAKAIQDINEKTLFPLEDSWYMGANIPGKVREQLMYLSGVGSYYTEVLNALDGWKGFNLIKEQKDDQVSSKSDKS